MLSVKSLLFITSCLALSCYIISFHFLLRCTIRTLRITELEATKTELESRLYAVEDDCNRLR